MKILYLNYFQPFVNSQSYSILNPILRLKEACKWIFSSLGLTEDLSNSQKIDLAFSKIEVSIAIKNFDKPRNKAVIDIKNNPAILQAFKSMKAGKTSTNEAVNVVTAGHHKKEDVIKAK